MGTIDETVTLAHALVDSVSGGKPRANVADAVAYLNEGIAATQALQVAQAKQINVTTATGLDPVILDQMTDRAWRGFKQRLEGAS